MCMFRVPFLVCVTYMYYVQYTVYKQNGCDPSKCPLLQCVLILERLCMPSAIFLPKKASSLQWLLPYTYVPSPAEYCMYQSHCCNMSSVSIGIVVAKPWKFIAVRSSRVTWSLGSESWRHLTTMSIASRHPKSCVSGPNEAPGQLLNFLPALLASNWTSHTWL